jgi:2-polyprenyl-3-methyl-5-hydroxy-6-metoxy-1,4-benzoquinol methylase
MNNNHIRNFYLKDIDRLFENAGFRNKFLSYNKLFRIPLKGNDRELFRQLLLVYLDEAEFALSILRKLEFSRKDVILEMGGGLGFVYGFLKRQGLDIYSIEPSQSGYAGYYETALQMFKVLGIDSSHWHPFFAEECGRTNRTFDIVFSYGVLEHVRDLRGTLLGLKSVLKPGGKMIHWTVNYLIPYEPHFKMLLFPFSPRTTSFFRPSLKHSPLWGGLNFVTAGKLKRVCRSCGLDITFKRGVVLESFQRLREEGFARRQKFFLPFYHFLQKTGLINTLNLIPIPFTTPLVIVLKHHK